MIAIRWTVFFLTALISATPISLVAQSEEEMREGIDVQSPEEIERARREIEETFRDAEEPHYFTEAQKYSILSKYNHLDARRDVPTDLLEKAVLYFDKNKDKFPNQEYMTIVDFRPRSDKYRLFVIDIKTGVVEKYHTTHGTHSDENKDGVAERFGNVINSGRSSLGFVRVSEEYDGKFGRAIRLDGLSSTNSNMRARAVVLHGWSKVQEKDVIQGWSWGCITLDYKIRDGVLDKVVGGSLLYAGSSKK